MLKKVYALALLNVLKRKGFLDKNSSEEIQRDIKKYLNDEGPVRRKRYARGS